MDFIRIGDKTISMPKLNNKIEQIFNLRSMGIPQQEVAEKLDVDRSFISKLESLGEIRRGGKIAFIGFPIENKDEISGVLDQLNVDFKIIMTEKERLDFIEKKTGAELINEVMSIAAELSTYDTTIIMCSDARNELMKAFLSNEILAFNIGHSPLTKDVYIDPEVVMEIIKKLRKG
ncbi:MAG: transcriptional regulator [Clostridia bacterium]|nr:transcriptional regulator [Clostridia bacterium]